MCWVIKLNKGKWEVGYFLPDCSWVCVFVCNNIETAQEKVNYLNGGNGEEL